nr:unnamed protein product [Digitaria exilis]
MAIAASLEQHEDDDIPSSVLLEVEGYFADRPNANTAWSKTSKGVPISVSFHLAHPPSLSTFSVHCPDLDLAKLSLPPKIIAADADLVLVRVPLEPAARWHQRHHDYFVYRMHPQRPKLDLIPNPRHERFGDDEIAILSCGDGKYVVAALRLTFELHLYRSSTNGGKTGSRWTSQRVSVEEPVRDRVCPIPKSAQPNCYHTTNKAITLGGDKGTVGWVDLWRGILLCDVLEESPKLRDIPLPLPTKGNWTRFLNWCPHIFRNISVNQSRDTIKYVEMDITFPEEVPVNRPRSVSDPGSFYEWVKRQECPEPQSYSLVPGRWTATTYSMPIPVSSWKDWRREFSVRLSDLKLPAENTMHYKLLHELISSSSGGVWEETISLAHLSMAYPTLSTLDGDDTVYLLLSKDSCEESCKETVEAVLSVDVRASTLQGVAKPDTGRYFSFRRSCLASGISKHLKTQVVGQ